MRLVVVVTQRGVNSLTKCLRHTQSDATATVFGATRNGHKWFENLIHLVCRYPIPVITYTQLEAVFAFVRMNLNRAGVSSMCNRIINQNMDDMTYICRVAGTQIGVWRECLMNLSLWMTVLCDADNLVDE